MMAIGLFLLFSNPIIINQLLKVWELKAATTGPKSHDAVIVLGGFMSIDKTNNSYSFGEGADKLTEGLILYKRGSIKKIILSGGVAVLLMIPVNLCLQKHSWLTTAGCLTLQY